MFSGCELWATDEQARDLSDMRNYDTETKGLPYVRFNIDWVEAFGCQSDHRSASRSRGPYIFRYIDVFGPVSVLDIISFFLCTSGITHHALESFKLSVP